MPDAHADTLVFFTPEENAGAPKDEFRVIQAELADEVLDLRAIGSADQVRAAILSGIRRPGIPGGRMFLWCKEDTLVGPVRLLNTSGSLSLEKTSSRHRIPCYRVKTSNVREVSDGRSTRCIATGSLGQPQSYVDWDEDHLVVRRALEFALKQDKFSGEKVVLSQKVLKEAAELIAQASDGADLALEQMRLGRARSLATSLELNVSNARALADLLRKHPEVVKELALAAKQEAERARTECEQQLKAEREQLETLKKERAKVSDELAKAKEALSSLALQKDKEVQDVERAVSERLQEVLKRPAALLAEAAVLRHVLGAQTAEGKAPQSKLASTRPILPWKRGATSVADSTELRKRLVSSLKQSGLAPGLGQSLHAGFTARLVPIIGGSRALQAAEAYARVVAGGRLSIIHASASAIEPGDLFGRLDVGGRRFVPHPGGLIDVVASARQSDGLQVVVVEGINRGPIESYLLPLIRLASGRGTPIPVFSPASVDEGDPYRPDHRVDWPSNLFLCGTLVEGPTTLPVTPDIWSDCVLLQAEVGEAVSGTGPADTTGPSEVAPGSELLQASPPLEDVTLPLFESVPELRVGHEAAVRFTAALRRFTTTAQPLKLEAFKGSILPLLATRDLGERSNELIKQFAAALSTPQGALAEMLEAVRRRLA
jgi:hypothetical protein